MITTFEDYTEELTSDELKWVELLLNGMEGKTRPTTANAIVRGMNKYAKDHKEEKLPMMTGVRFRRLVNLIRSNSIAPLVANSKGYFLATKRRDVELQIKSSRQRANSILASADGLVEFLRHN